MRALAISSPRCLRRSSASGDSKGSLSYGDSGKSIKSRGQSWLIDYAGPDDGTRVPNSAGLRASSQLVIPDPNARMSSSVLSVASCSKNAEHIWGRTNVHHARLRTRCAIRHT